MEEKRFDVVVIGGGASGLAAAIDLKLKSPGTSVAIIEKNDSLGRKIRATGNGRCNITNTHADGYNTIMEFFRKIGIVTRTHENGLVYPYSESAADVVELLIDRASELGVEAFLETTVYRVSKDETFTVWGKRKEGAEFLDIPFVAKNVVLALGGKAGAVYGTTGDGYAIARDFGHTIVTPIPVLTSVECMNWDESLAGVRAQGKVSLYKDPTEEFSESSKIFEENGEIQFTKYGLSGICIFNMSRHMRFNKAGGENLEQFMIELDLFSDGDIQAFIADRENEHLFNDNNILRTILKSELADYVVRMGVDSIHKLRFRPSVVRGWQDAQATSGGVSLDEVDIVTCESNKCRGLYITGELLNYDGPCGGYNLSNAWFTGLKASKAIYAKMLGNETL